MKSRIKRKKKKINNVMKMKKKIKLKWFISLVIFVFAFSISFPFLNKYYIKPKRWKNELFQQVINRDPSIDRDAVKLFCDCVYDKLIKTYKSVGNIPPIEYFTNDDRENMVKCSILYFVNDNGTKKFLNDNIKEISNGSMKLDTLK
jgi:hypothetical protein